MGIKLSYYLEEVDTADLPRRFLTAMAAILAHSNYALVLEAAARMKTETHRLARHQNAWFKADDPRIRWLDAGEGVLEEAERLVESEIGSKEVTPRER